MKTLRLLTLCTAVLLTGVQMLDAQEVAGVLEITAPMPAGRSGGAAGMVADANGDFYVCSFVPTASSSGVHTAKYSRSTGALIWSRTYGGVTTDTANPAGICLGSDGNVMIIGSHSLTFNFGIFAAKYSAATGALMWSSHYDGTTLGPDHAQDAAVDREGNLLVLGVTESGANADDIVVLKIDGASGARIWDRKVGGTRFDSAGGIAVDANGDVFVTGGLGVAVGANPYKDFFTAKLAGLNGDTIWQRTYNGPGNQDDVGADAAVDAAGNVVVTGFSYDQLEDVYTIKYSPAGDVVWQKRKGVFNTQLGRVVRLDGSGNAFVGAYWNATGSGRHLTVKYAAADGAELWERQLGVDAQAGDGSMEVTASGDVVVAGSNMGVTKYAGTDGTVLWSGNYFGSAGTGIYSSTQLALTPDGFAALCGSRPTGPATKEPMTVKFMPAPPTAATSAATFIVENGGRLNGTAGPKGWPSMVSFLHGTGGVLNRETIGAFSNGANGVLVSEAISEYPPETLVDYRLKVVGPGGTTLGAVMQFKTAQGAPPTGGTFSLNKSAVRPGVGITASFAGWEDLSPPLTYQVKLDGVPRGAPGTSSTIQFSAALPEGVRTVTGVIYDAFGTAAEVSQNIVVDGTPPILTLPPAVIVTAFSPPGVEVTVPLASISAVDALDPAPQVTVSSSGTIFVLTDTLRNVIVTATDAAGNRAQDSFYVGAVRGYVESRISAQAGKINGTLVGTELSDAPGFQLYTFGVPSLTNLGHLVMTGAARNAAGAKRAGIIVGRSGYYGGEVPFDTQWVMPLGIGAPADAVGAGLAWKAFPREPFLDSADDEIPRPLIGFYTKPSRVPIEFGFHGRVTGPGVSAENDDVLAYFAEQPLVPAETIVVAREGGDAPGVNGGKFKSFQYAAMATMARDTSSSSLPPSGRASVAAIAFTAMLQTGPRGTPGPGGVDKSSDMGLWIWEDGAEQLVLREGQLIEGRTVRSFVTLRGPVGHGKAFTRSDGGPSRFSAMVLVTFTDGVKWLMHARPDMLVKIGGTRSFAELGYSGPAAEWSGFPAWGRDGDGRFAIVATMRGVPSSENSTIVGEVGGDPRRLVSKGTVLGDGSVVTALGAPVLNRDTMLAFTAKTNQSSATRLFTRDVDGDFRQSFEVGAQAPGANGALWRKLEQHALPNGLGPLFTARLHIGSAAAPAPGGVTAANDLGLWCVDSFGTTQLLVREGQDIAGKTVRAFKALTTVAGSPGQSRSFNGQKTVIVWVLATDNTQHVVNFAVP